MSINQYLSTHNRKCASVQKSKIYLVANLIELSHHIFLLLLPESKHFKSNIARASSNVRYKGDTAPVARMGRRGKFSFDREIRCCASISHK